MVGFVKLLVMCELVIENVPFRTPPKVNWPVRRAQPELLVPKTAVVTTNERVFVIRDRDGRAEWVDVRRGPVDGDLVQVDGNLAAGDRVVRRATDEIREGTSLTGR